MWPNVSCIAINPLLKLNLSKHPIRGSSLTAHSSNILIFTRAPEIKTNPHQKREEVSRQIT